MVENLATIIAQQVVEYSQGKIPIKYGYRGYFSVNNFEWSIENVINRFLTSTDHYESWLLFNLIINQRIRQKEYNITNRYLEELKVNNFDYWNSISYSLRTFESVEKSSMYLMNRISIHDFLSRTDMDYAESLVLKIFATMLIPWKNSKKKLWKNA